MKTKCQNPWQQRSQQHCVSALRTNLPSPSTQTLPGSTGKQRSMKTEDTSLGNRSMGFLSLPFAILRDLQRMKICSPVSWIYTALQGLPGSSVSRKRKTCISTRDQNGRQDINQKFYQITLCRKKYFLQENGRKFFFTVNERVFLVARRSIRLHAILINGFQKTRLCFKQFCSVNADLPGLGGADVCLLESLYSSIS